MRAGSPWKAIRSPRHADPAREALVVRELVEDRASVAAMSAGSPDSATHLNGPRPSQNSGRM